eukprot:13769222-Alexandrium_andersonii.AAC.1
MALPTAGSMPPMAESSPTEPARPPWADVAAGVREVMARMGAKEGRAARRMRACAHFGRPSG